MNEAFLKLGVEVVTFVDAGDEFCGVHGEIPLAGCTLNGYMLKGFDDGRVVACQIILIFALSLLTHRRRHL